MANRNLGFRISWTAIVPILFAAIAFLAVLTASILSQHYQSSGQDSRVAILIWAALWALVAFVAALIVTRRLLKPTRNFTQRITDLPVMAWSEDGRQRIKKVTEFHDTESVFQRTEDVLMRLEARHLFPELVGESQIMQALLGRVHKAAATEAPILLTGERGTGKGLVAASIHINSMRKEHPFIKLHCRDLSPDALEDELCGKTTSRSGEGPQRRPGKIELARGGTVFIDEIGDLPPRLQEVILQVVSDKEIRLADTTRAVPADVRVLASTAKNLERMVYEGTFREDLYEKIKLFSLQLPPLRDRRADIPLLVEDCLARTAPRSKITPQALQLLIGYSWPGNVRELLEVMKSALAISQGQDVAAAHLPEAVNRSVGRLNGGAGDDQTMSIDDKLQEIEKDMIIDALKQSNGVQVRAAELMGINQRSLWHRIKKYQIDPSAYKSPQ